MTKKITDFWFVLTLFSLFYFWGLSFVSFLGLVVFTFWFFPPKADPPLAERKKPISWWLVIIFCLVNILVFRTPLFFLTFGLFFYFYLRYADSAFVATSAKEAGYGKASLRYASQPADSNEANSRDAVHPDSSEARRGSSNEATWFQAFLLFVSSFDLFFLASNYRFMLGISWVIFFGLTFWLIGAGVYFKDYSKIARLVFSFVFSQLFFILYFLPFGNFTNAGVTTIFFMALSNYKKNHSLKQLFVLTSLCLLLLWLSGIRPR